MAMTRGGSRRRRGGPVAALVTAVVLLWPGTAWAADASFTPTQARQGESVKVEFVVPDERPGIRTERIEVRLPADNPIAEVYPLSVDGWAPLITTRKLDTPVAGLHAPATDIVTATVTWSRTPNAGDGPARLPLSMGPLPQTDRLAFELLQTYADGMVVRWGGPGQRPLPALALLPADPAAPGGHGAHGGAPDGQPSAGDPPAEATGDGGPNANSLLAAGLVAGLGGGAVVGWLISRWRRNSAEEIDRSVLDGEPTGDDADTTGRAGSEAAEAGARR
ncbi:DUF1775 domain-containing protein [Micromonospora sp. WMMD1082]|uniref:DUF1775 domain-containing protein n=1 Tax=Micromonospora sp. WMMD1082 TaxID=3016104 RepID=UPI0024176264|nr:DUF1775 domain-containing protein [Micromonospora sp. WMMD1082]MDG4798598.1 DUF1775 domain-containing protein [Micromonospora sp. WMMD1082]